VKHYGLTLCLRDDPEVIAAYVRHHQAVWPPVCARLREVGVQAMRIFLRGRRLFMYIETSDDFDLARDFARVNQDPVSAEWNRWMATLQERAPEAHPDEWWAPMELVFDLDWPQHRHESGVPGRSESQS
jgi:L-rhamnose mutarotase